MLSPPRRAKHLVCTVNLRAGSAEPVPVCRNLSRRAGTRLPGSASFGFVTLRMPQNRTTGSALPGRFQPGAYESKILRSKWRRFEKDNSHPPNQRFPATKSQ